MSEFICKLTGELCVRPGKVFPGATTISNEGFCGGEKPEDGICPVFSSFVDNEDFLSDPNVRVIERAC